MLEKNSLLVFRENCFGKMCHVVSLCTMARFYYASLYDGKILLGKFVYYGKILLGIFVLWQDFTRQVCTMARFY